MKLVFLPGFDGTGNLFKPLLDIFPDSIETLIISYPTDKNLSI
jgi:hypothetical protein